jgi:hypothetical protein
MWTDLGNTVCKIAHRHMNVLGLGCRKKERKEIGIEAAQFPEKEY